MKQYFEPKLFFILTFFIAFTSFSQTQNEVIPLWQNEIPGAIANNDYKEEQEVKGGMVEFYSKVSVPTLTVFKPEKPNGTAVVICPGGAYLRLYMIGEGYKVAKWLNSIGVTAFILKYRLPHDQIMKDKTIGPLQDAQESIRYLRRNAEKWNINPDKVGIIGFSAGGHLASTLSTHYNDAVYKVADNSSAKPNFSILVYPVISMDETITHKGSKTNLLGTEPSKELIEKYSNDKQIDAATPPTYIVHAFDDTSVVIENSIQYFLALRKNKVPSEIHLFQTGKHGFGMGRPATTSQNWTKQCEEWLKFNQFITIENPTNN
jgi:acetyl esterase/lipase